MLVPWVAVPGDALDVRSVAAIRTTEGRAHSEATFSEVHAVPDGTAYSVIRYPADQRLIDPTLVDEVLQEFAHGIISPCSNDSGIQAETTL